MEPTIDQALQQGVAAHKEGKLQEAERLYQAILQSQPKHPDANHNLGLIARAANKVDTALPLFKTALEANPKIEQFWLSYIETLIKGKQSEAATKVLEEAKKQGVAQDKINLLRGNFNHQLLMTTPNLLMQKSIRFYSTTRMVNTVMLSSWPYLLAKDSPNIHFLGRY